MPLSFLRVCSSAQWHNKNNNITIECGIVLLANFHGNPTWRGPITLDIIYFFLTIIHLDYYFYGKKSGISVKCVYIKLHITWKKNIAYIITRTKKKMSVLYFRDDRTTSNPFRIMLTAHKIRPVNDFTKTE